MPSKRRPLSFVLSGSSKRSSRPNGSSPVPLGWHGGGLDGCLAVREERILHDPNPAKDFRSGWSSGSGEEDRLVLLAGASLSLGLVL